MGMCVHDNDENGKMTTTSTSLVFECILCTPYLDRIQNSDRFNVHPRLEAINEGTSHIFSRHGVDVSKGFQKRRVGLMGKKRDFGIL